ncbi:hypothetical protein [Planctomicrobium sp. SH664]|uniref:hypothetical protein n=1 Tax=Planctomicrobium sp. SH664 TaxID=3448125 RepID=UPI003F5C3D0E
MDQKPPKMPEIGHDMIARNLPEIGKLFRVNERTIQRWRDAGMPLIRGKGGYLIGPCVQWHECRRSAEFLRKLAGRSQLATGEILLEIADQLEHIGRSASLQGVSSGDPTP